VFNALPMSSRTRPRDQIFALRPEASLLTGHVILPEPGQRVKEIFGSAGNSCREPATVVAGLQFLAEGAAQSANY
jgi:hypothetical protein